MKKYKQGEIFFVDLEPAKGTEPKKKRPCIIVSNDNYNKYFNTVLIVPISSSSKYRSDPKYLDSPLFETIKAKNIEGTALLQHLRAVDPRIRINSDVSAQIGTAQMNKISEVIKQFL
ncbi:type II toxin-antitoxin system PemK/MazF family toxin [Companilactobacillus nodensis]|uniref:mRNA interferase n=1 Tax=Companilactobacillus nodensis DSM 19682 = JCM 14932 = NBRC 107160 TaxID=1423775 RepID=A0A0R1KAE2_9LACO|nr:type II toxin-antitoxin system PemK/MazF family toxin [Companilactobacillus nodensis]KRK80464.1 hypothetical protein FD03_GL001888 [Companilactobacillus nodensis DSM 19682 = JCM 14932 = NBRC 107160]